jgi:hypothetical protein
MLQVTSEGSRALHVDRSFAAVATIGFDALKWPEKMFHRMMEDSNI